MLQQRPMYAYIPAKDLDRARRFYEKTLGFSPTREVNGGVFYECAGGSGAFLYVTPNAGTSQASQAFWPVEDIEREVADLKQRGVTMEQYGKPAQKPNGSVDDGCGKAAWV